MKREVDESANNPQHHTPLLIVGNRNNKGRKGRDHNKDLRFTMNEKYKHIRTARHSAISLSLHLENGDEIIEMISRENGLFFLSREKIIRYRSPDVIDPDIEHESVHWNQSLILPHGASDPIVARTIIQTSRLLKIFFSKESELFSVVSDISWEIMHSLVSLRFIKKRLERQIDKLITVIESDLAAYTLGDNPKPLPIVEYYDIEFRSFANEVRRGLSIISDLFFPLTGQDMFKGGKFDKAQQWAEKEKGVDSLLTKMLSGDQRWIKTWIDIRIAIEHPKKDRFVETRNFTLEADKTISLPTWRFVHSDYDMEKPQNLLEIMEICINNLLKFYEDLLICLTDGHLPSTSKVEYKEIPNELRNKKIPLRYEFRMLF